MTKHVDLKDKYEGEVICSKQDGYFEIIEYINAKNVVVKFIETGYTTVCRITNVLNGKVKDRLKPSVYGVGVLGEKLPLKEGTGSKEYSVWVRMLDRCYNKNNKKTPTYEGCTVSKDFLHFHKFKGWCSEQVGFGKEGFALDKDILSGGSKVYSPETCVFVPQEINNFLTNIKSEGNSHHVGAYFDKKSGKYKVCFSRYSKTTNLGYFDCIVKAAQTYKEAKENHAKELAEKWKDQIDGRVYEALTKWRVSADD